MNNLQKVIVLVVISIVGCSAKPQALDDIAVIVSASESADEVPQEGRNYFPIDETADDVAGFRLPRLIDDGESDKTLDAGTFAIIVESSPPEGREEGSSSGGSAFIPVDNSAPNKAGFRLPLPRTNNPKSDEKIELDVFIVEAETEDDSSEDAFVVVAAPTNPEELDDSVVIVGGGGQEREPKDFEILRRPSQVDCAAPLDRGTCQRRSVDQAEEEAYYYDAREGKCVFFLYSGCGGNTNRFSNQVECEMQCKKEESQPRSLGEDSLEDLEIDSSVCSAPGGKPGICKGAFQYFYFKKETGTCEPFVFGGCEAGSTENKFPTVELCEKTCISDSSSKSVQAVLF